MQTTEGPSAAVELTLHQCVHHWEQKLGQGIATEINICHITLYPALANSVVSGIWSCSMLSHAMLAFTGAFIHAFRLDISWQRVREAYLGSRGHLDSSSVL